jgi:hypothetical protein
MLGEMSKGGQHMYGLRIATIAALAVVAAALGAVPAGAAGIPTTGTQIALGQCVAAPCVSTYPAGEPFFVEHGFIQDPGTDVSDLLDPRTRFELTVDGHAVPAALELDVAGSPVSKLYLTNFRFGMSGVHTLVGCWYAAGVLQYCGTRTITFTE